jgi:uncharacterized protein (TIGR00297 family)
LTDAGLDAVLSRLPWALALNGAMAVAAYLLRTVRLGGAVGGTLLGTCVLAFAGWGPFFLLGAFFVLGSLVTRWGWAAKERRGVAETHRGARGVRQVIANGAPAVALAVVFGVGDGSMLLMIGYAGALAAASADTASSELGQVYGTRPVSVPGFKRVPIGTPGAVSGAGTIAGALAAALMGLAAAAAGMLPLPVVPIVAFGAVIAGLSESLLAPVLRGSSGHHVLNLLNSCVGAVASMGLWRVLF